MSNTPAKRLRRSKRQAKAQAQTARHSLTQPWQVPIVRDRNIEDIIGFVTLNPDKVPPGSDWGLQPGVDKQGRIIVFSTMLKGNRSSFTQ